MKNKWHKFTSLLPRHGCSIMVKDYDGNMSPGVWCEDSFYPFFEIPIAYPINWTYVKILKIITPDEIQIDPYHLTWMNGRKIDLKNIYDRSDPLSSSKK